MQNYSGHNNLRIYFSKYTNTCTHEDPEFTPSTLPPPSLRITSQWQRQRQSQAKNRHKILVDCFTKGLGRLRG